MPWARSTAPTRTRRCLEPRHTDSDERRDGAPELDDAMSVPKVFHLRTARRRRGAWQQRAGPTGPRLGRRLFFTYSNKINLGTRDAVDDDQVKQLVQKEVVDGGRMRASGPAAYGQAARHWRRA